MAFNFQFYCSVRIENGFKVVSHEREVSDFLASRMGEDLTPLGIHQLAGP